MHAPPQTTSPALHVYVQAPLSQACPGSHFLPQVPQLRLSDAVFAQNAAPPSALASAPASANPQVVSPAAQVNVHCPFEQT